MSLSKQATQIPMFGGFPEYCSSTAVTPMAQPTATIPARAANGLAMQALPSAAGCEATRHRENS